MPIITCPEGHQTNIDVFRKSADEFCKECDFPLFWAKMPARLGGDFADTEPDLRRFPGTVGRVTAATEVCPHCQENNLLGAIYCVACGKLLHPPPDPEPVVVVAPPPPPPPEPEPEPVKEHVWPWVVALVSLLVLVTLLILWWG